jgi:hypothetical protein
MVPIHYDTFVNSTDEPGDALRELTIAKKKWDLGTREIVPLAIGERRMFVKKGEGPEAASPAGVPAKTTPAPAAAPAAADKPKLGDKPKPKDEIPDDQKLD